MQAVAIDEFNNSSLEDTQKSHGKVNVSNDVDIRLPYRFFKRAFDIVFSSVMIVVGLIPGAVLAVLVAKDTGGSPIYTQERIGKDKKPFKILKYRTMVKDSDDLEKHFTKEQLEIWHKEHKVEGDPRITKLGKTLRKTSIDEFPQFLNVFVGQMSVIGPRPVTKEELNYFGSNTDLLLSMRPGISGWWQTQSRNDATFQSGDRQALELDYIKQANPRMDAKIFIDTLSVMFGKEKSGR